MSESIEDMYRRLYENVVNQLVLCAGVLHVIRTQVDEVGSHDLLTADYTVKRIAILLDGHEERMAELAQTPYPQEAPS